MIFNENLNRETMNTLPSQSAAKSASELEQERLLKERNAQRLKEVEKQQADFGEKK